MTGIEVFYLYASVFVDMAATAHEIEFIPHTMVAKLAHSPRSNISSRFCDIVTLYIFFEVGCFRKNRSAELVNYVLDSRSRGCGQRYERQGVIFP